MKSLVVMKAASDAQMLAEEKRRHILADEANMPDITLLDNGDVWTNLTTGREMVAMDGVFIESSTTPAATVGIERMVENQVNGLVAAALTTMPPGKLRDQKTVLTEDLVVPDGKTYVVEDVLELDGYDIILQGSGGIRFAGYNL